MVVNRRRDTWNLCEFSGTNKEDVLAGVHRCASLTARRWKFTRADLLVVLGAHGHAESDSTHDYVVHVAWVPVRLSVQAPVQRIICLIALIQGGVLICFANILCEVNTIAKRSASVDPTILDGH